MSASRRPLIAGNWKMNGAIASARVLAGALTHKAGRGPLAFDMVLCPPFPLMGVVSEALDGSPLTFGAQDCHSRKSGAYTGDTSASLLKEVGCSHVIVGHSERRKEHGETDAMVREKAEAAQAAGLTAIICLGETEAERDAGEARAVVDDQLTLSLPEGGTPENTVIAYEPVWAIGTGRTPTAEEVAEIHGALRARLKEVMGDGDGSGERVRILYGGSMKPANAAELLALEDVDGGLIGGASLDAEDFWAIAEAAPRG